MALTDNNGTQYYQISCGVPSTTTNVTSNNFTGYYYKESNDYILWGQQLDHYIGSESNATMFPYYYECSVDSDSGLNLESNSGSHYYYSPYYNCVEFCPPLYDIDTSIISYDGVGLMYDGEYFTYDG